MGEQTLEAKLLAQHEVIEALGTVIRDLEHRLARVEGAVPSATAAPPSRPVPDGRDDGAPAARAGTTDRRHLLSTAATVAAGAVVGGTALALTQASPAAAAAGTFDGNPAVTGAASPTSHRSVRHHGRRLRRAGPGDIRLRRLRHL